MSDAVNDKAQGPDGQVSGVLPGGGDPTAWMIALVAVVSVVVIIAIMLFLRGIFQRAQDAEYYAKVVAVPETELNDLRDKQETALNSIRWIDPQQGIVSIPIEQAMALTVQELNAGAAPAPATAAARPAPEPVEEK